MAASPDAHDHVLEFATQNKRADAGDPGSEERGGEVGVPKWETTRK